MNLHLTKNPRTVINRWTACSVPPVAKLCTNRKSCLPMNESHPDLPSPCLACCDLRGRKPGYHCPLVCAPFERPNLLFAFLLARICWGLLVQSSWFSTGFAGIPCVALRLFSKERSWFLGLVQPRIMWRLYLIHRTFFRHCATSILNR